MNPRPPKQQVHCFTLKHNGLANRIITPVHVSGPFDPTTPPVPSPKLVKVHALWDTGATQSVITEATATSLGLIATGKKLVHHAGGKGEYNTHLVNFFLPNQVGVAGVLVSECPDIVGPFGAIVGMDIIMRGDLAITNHNGQTWVSFRYPSMHAVDYVDEFNRMQQRFAVKVGRNEPCPCGSGKKYKKCHGFV